MHGTHTLRISNKMYGNSLGDRFCLAQDYISCKYFYTIIIKIQINFIIKIKIQSEHDGNGNRGRSHHGYSYLIFMHA